MCPQRGKEAASVATDTFRSIGADRQEGNLRAAVVCMGAAASAGKLACLSRVPYHAAASRAQTSSAHFVGAVRALTQKPARRQVAQESV